MAGACKFVDAKVQQRRVLLFSKSYVPACSQIKEILDSFKLPPKYYEIVNIESRQDVNQIENYFQGICLTDRREVPQLFIDGKYIGGQKEILFMHRSGDLSMRISQAMNEENKAMSIR